MRRRIAFLAAFLGWPTVCLASDPTGLFVLLFGVPSVLLAVVFAAIAWNAPRGGAVLCGMLLISDLPLVAWASRVGYMDSAGIWLILSISIAVIGLFISLNRMVWPAKKPEAMDGDP